MNENSIESYNAKFTLRGRKDALSNSESSYPGADTIVYAILKHSLKDAKTFLLIIIRFGKLECFSIAGIALIVHFKTR